MLISRVASKAYSSSDAASGSFNSSQTSMHSSGSTANTIINDRKGSLNYLWSTFQKNLKTSFECHDFMTSIYCDIMDSTERHWIPTISTIQSDGTLVIRAINNDHILSTTSLFQSTVIGHLDQDLVQVFGATVTILLKCRREDFPRVCASLLAYSKLRPAGIESKMWLPTPGGALYSKPILLSSNVKAYFTPYNPLIAHPWTQYGASLSGSGELRLVNNNNQVVYSLQITKVLGSHIVPVDPSLVGSNLVLLVFPDLGGPETVYIRFNDRYECEEWVATLRAMSLQPVATPLNHEASKSIRWAHSLMVNLGYCDAPQKSNGSSSNKNGGRLTSSHSFGSLGNSSSTNYSRLPNSGSNTSIASILNNNGPVDNTKPEEGKYIEICLNQWRYARSCISIGSESCNWNEIFEFNDASPATLSPTVIELKLKQTSRTESGYSENDQAIGATTVAARSPGRWDVYDFSPSKYKVSIFFEQKNLPVLDVAYYSRLNDWLSDLQLNLTSILVSYNTSSLNKLFPIFDKAYRAQGRQLEWIFYMISTDAPSFSSAWSTLFRENTLLSKAIEALLHQQGREVLSLTVGRFIRKLLEVTSDPLELDPAKLQDEERLSKNTESMLKFMTLLWSFIRYEKLPPLCKPVFRHFKHVYEAIGLEGKELQETLYRTLSSFLFLRFYVPALVNPQHSRLTQFVLNAGQRRTLVLIAKILQAFSNRVKFGKKEQWLIPMNSFIESNETSLTQWYDSILSDTNSMDEKPDQEDSEKPPKQVPVNTFMGMQLSSPGLIDEPAVYSQLANYMSSEFEKDLTEEGKEKLKNDHFIMNVLNESKNIVQRQEKIISMLNEADDITDCNKDYIPELHLNSETLLFGSNPDQLEPIASRELQHMPTDIQVNAPAREHNDTKTKNLAVRKLTQMFGKLGKS